MTPCEEKGYKVGDRFELIIADAQDKSKGFQVGDIVTLVRDDGGDSPAFSTLKTTPWHFLLHQVKPLKEQPLNQSMQDWYLQGHKACGIEAGDKVKVLRAAKNYEMGWGTVWNSSMNEQIGEVLTVRGDRGGNGFLMEGGYSYPFFVLEFIEKGEKPIRIGGHTVEFKDNGIQVGRTFVNKEIVKEIAKRLEK